MRAPCSSWIDAFASCVGFLDRRSAEEFGAGHAPSAKLVPFAFKTPDGMSPNPDFVQEVRRWSLHSFLHARGARRLERAIGTSSAQWPRAVTRAQPSLDQARAAPPVVQVEAAFPNRDEALVVACKAGNRSTKAIAALGDAGYTNLKNFIGGWDAWAAAGLPQEK